MGFEILLKGNNMLRLLQGLWVALRISLISVVISIVLGILLGMLMTSKNKVIQVITRVYLEIVRIMPQLVLLFIVYFGATKAMGINIEAETASIIVFVFWGTAEMADLVRGSLISIPKIQYESSESLGLSLGQTYQYVIIPQIIRRMIPLSINLINSNDQDNESCHDDRNRGSVKSRTTDHRSEPKDFSKCCIRDICDDPVAVFYRMLADKLPFKIS